MQITLLQGLLITIAVMIIAIDNELEGFFLFRPIIVAPIVGAILGDVKTGLMAGGLVELAFAGITPVGGVVPPNAIMAAVMTVVLAKTTGQSVQAAFTLAYPFGLLMQYVNTVACTAYSGFNRKAEKCAANCDIKGLNRLCGWGLLINSLLYGVVCFLSVYAMQDAMKSLVDVMPAFLTNGLSVAGGLIPAVGFAMLLRVMLKPKYVPYLIAGFLFATYINISNIMPVALMGVAFGLVAYFKEDKVEGADNNEEGI
jgi:PTS system galactosamine-specific IIC component